MKCNIPPSVSAHLRAIALGVFNDLKTQAVALRRAVVRGGGLSDTEVILKLLPNIFHELNNALGVITNVVALINRRFERAEVLSAEDIKDELQILHGELLKASLMVRAVMAFFIEGSEEMTVHCPCDVLSQYQLFIEKHASVNNVRFSCDYSRLIRGKSNITISGRELHAILNDVIVKGALLACEKSSCRTRLFLSISATMEVFSGKSFIRVVVEDNGMLRDHLVSAKTRDLVSTNNGKIEAYSTQGTTTVSIWFLCN